MHSNTATHQHSSQGMCPCAPASSHPAAKPHTAHASLGAPTYPDDFDLHANLGFLGMKGDFLQCCKLHAGRVVPACTRNVRGNRGHRFFFVHDHEATHSQQEPIMEGKGGEEGGSRDGGGGQGTTHRKKPNSWMGYLYTGTM